ncbi:MAG: hypothetical protein ACI4DK_11240 [Lachnospiraceae bacterium]
MDYVIKIGKNYIGVDSDGRYTEFEDNARATRGPLHKMSNIVNNSIPPTKRAKCKIIPYTPSMAPTFASTPKHVADVPVNSLFDSVFTELKKVDLTAFNKEQGELSQKLSKIDQEICDIQHYIEFNKLNAAEGYKAFKLLQDKLLERRIIKDDFSKFQMLSAAKVSDIFDGTLDARINELENRTYAPRVLKELFD